MSTSTDSNYVHAFDVPGNLAPTCSWELIQKASTAAEKLNIKVRAGNVVSCDVFYEPDGEWWKKWAKMGVMAVEMEAAALYMNAAYLGANALCMVTISDHFVTGEQASAEERQSSFTDMMKIALEAAVL
jgi:purine-nucleoside phosphorylase